MDNYELPPGFRFHPTDEELIVYYLRNQAMSLPCPSAVIPQLNLYKFDPWQLPGKSELSEREWYFFTTRSRKYPNGVRPNRATTSGYWKATGTDKPIYSSSRSVGLKKALVFYNGRPPKGSKTGWIMHEYRLSTSPKPPFKSIHSIPLDEWVLCRIYQKRQSMQIAQSPLQMEYGAELPKISRSCSLAHLLELESSGLGFIDDLFSGIDGGSGDLVEDEGSSRFQIHMDAIF